jgi:hypothetical protein
MALYLRNHRHIYGTEPGWANTDEGELCIAIGSSEMTR